MSMGEGGGGGGRANSMYYYDDMHLGGGGGGGEYRGGGSGGGYHTISGYQATGGFHGGGGGYQVAGGGGGGGSYQVVGGGGGGYQVGGGGYQVGGGGYQVGGGGGGSYQVVGGGGGGYQMTTVHTQSRAAPPPDLETMSLHSIQMQPNTVAAWMARDDSDGSVVSERNATFPKSKQHAFYTSNGITQSASSSATQLRTSATLPPMRRSLSGTLAQSGGGMGMEESVERQYSFKGPAHRTISRIAQRNNRMSMGSTSGGSVYGGGGGGGGFIMSSGSQNNLGRISRAMSTKSMQSVGKGLDVFDGQMTGNMDLSR